MENENKEIMKTLYKICQLKGDYITRDAIGATLKRLVELEFQLKGFQDQYNINDKLTEENEKLKHDFKHVDNECTRLEEQNEKLKEENESMRNCGNCGNSVCITLEHETHCNENNLTSWQPKQNPSSGEGDL